MHVAVVGGGVVGIATAYCLRRHGCEVIVYDRHRGAAQEASFASGGVICAAVVAPWAAPGEPSRLLAALFRSRAPSRAVPRLDAVHWRWLRRFISESRLDRFRSNLERLTRLAAYSREQLQAVHARHAIDYERQAGLLQLFRSERDLERHQATRSILQDLGVAQQVLSPAECRTVECAINEHSTLAGGIHYPDDETGNCAYFARRLKEVAERDGVRFSFGQQIKGLDIQGGRIAGVLTEAGPHSYEAVVVAAGAASGSLLAAAGVPLPLVGVVSYSATANITRHELAPLQSIADASAGVSVARMGRRLRIAGMARLGPGTAQVTDRAARYLLDAARHWYPGAAAFNEAQFFAGMRADLPDGLPLLGASPVPGLFVNAGHGNAGWTVACGTAQIVADVVTGRTPQIDVAGLGFDRFLRSAPTAGAKG
ncbi:MAG: D-amino acid dehydrogenase [Betaproteobacteria bacterium]